MGKDLRDLQIITKNIKTEFSMTIFSDNRCIPSFCFPLKAFNLFRDLRV